MIEEKQLAYVERDGDLIEIRITLVDHTHFKEVR